MIHASHTGIHSRPYPESSFLALGRLEIVFCREGSVKQAINDFRTPENAF